MDSIFLLSPEARSYFLQSSARAIGCTYICIWSYIPYPSNCLICADAWFDVDQSRRIFDLYRASFCSVESGCVPGLAYKEGLPYIELEDSNLMNLTSTQVQRQFYQEAGIKKAVFLGSKNGEIEIGMASNMNNINMQMLNQLFNEDLITQQSQFATDLSHPSSSSSSLRSLSVGSPEYSSLLPPTQSIPINPPLQNIQFPTPASDEEAIMRAMLTVISSNSPSASSPNVYNSSLRAFKPYNTVLAPKVNIGTRQRLGGHKMIKMGISILRRMDLMRSEARVNQELRAPSGNQLQHMISERKRREKINESFNALKMLLPSGCKKDKASVLLRTREYLKSLKSQISELEEKNKKLESQLMPSDHEIKMEAGGNPNERVQVQIIRSQESTSQIQGITLRIIIRVECNMHDLLLHVLECLKEMGFVSMTSVNANTFSPQIGVFALLSLTLQVKASDWDEQSFKEAVTSAINYVVEVRPETVPNDS